MIEKLRIAYQHKLSVKIAVVSLVVLLSVAIMIPLVILAESLGVNIRENTGLNFKVTFGNIFFFFLFGSCSIGIIWLAQKYIHLQKISELGFTSGGLKLLFIGFLIGVLLVSLRYLSLVISAEKVEYNYVIPSNIPVLKYIAYYIYFFFGIIFWNSFIEELGTRAYPIERLKKHINPYLVFAIMGIIFTVGHFILNEFSLGYLLSLFTASYLYSLLYYYSGSIWLSIGVHSGANWVSFSFFNDNWEIGSIYNIIIYDVPLWVANYSNVVIQFIALLVVIMIYRAGYFPKKPSKIHHKQADNK